MLSAHKYNGMLIATRDTEFISFDGTIYTTKTVAGIGSSKSEALSVAWDNIKKSRAIKNEMKRTRK